MSTIITNELQGLEMHNREMKTDSESHLNINGTMSMGSGGILAIPRGPTSTRPPIPSAGMIRYNTQLRGVEVYDGSKWLCYTTASAADGSTEGQAAQSARALWENGIVTSGKGTRWIRTTNGPKEVYCDFDTLDQNGKSGWMMVGAFDQGRWWGGKNVDVVTTDELIDSGNSSYVVSSNFLEDQLNMFRITSASGGDVGDSEDPNSLGSGAAADWYYKWEDQIAWKEVWAPAQDQHYLSNGSNPNVQRTSLRKFDSSYNIKFSYNNPNHKYNNISDFGNTNGRTDLPDYSYGTIGGGNAPASGWWDPWVTLASAGNKFNAYYIGRSANYQNNSSGDSDGTLAIPTNGAGTDTTGQDVDSNIGAKVGNDDNTNWGGATSNGTSNAGNNGAISTQKLWWWIK
tara:strand:- start:3675 stop:4874 length:1200 start_codon:yes stop_codon:yes gene_type:complete